MEVQEGDNTLIFKVIFVRLVGGEVRIWSDIARDEVQCRRTVMLAVSHVSVLKP